MLIFCLFLVFFDHLFEMLPEDVTHEVRGQLQEALLAQVTQHLAVHAEPLQVHVHQAELVGGPEEPLAHLLLVPQPGVLGDAQAALLLLEAAEGGFEGLTHHRLAARRQQGQLAAGGVMREGVQACGHFLECLLLIQRGNAANRDPSKVSKAGWRFSVPR